MVQFPELFDKRLKNGDPKGAMYWKWCQLQLTIHKPWKNNYLMLWGDYARLEDIPKQLFIDKWKEFVTTTEAGREVQNRFDRHRTERAACNDALFDLDKYDINDVKCILTFGMGLRFDHARDILTRLEAKRASIHVQYISTRALLK